MQTVFTARNLADAYLVVHILEDAGIRATVRNEQLVGAAGEVPVSPDSWPKVEVAEADVDAAMSAIQEHEESPDAGETLDDLDDGSESDGGAAQEALGDLYLAVQHFVHKPGSSGRLAEVDRLSQRLAGTASPYGVESTVWEGIQASIRGLLEAAGAGDNDGVQTKAQQLRNVIGPLVGRG